MNRELIEELKELVMSHGVSGYEDEVREKIMELIAPHLPDGADVRTDSLGNLLVTVGEGKKHMAFVAHMDEIGMVVSRIEKGGTLRIKILGGIDVRTLVARIVRIKTESGYVRGVIGLKPPHLMKPGQKPREAPSEDQIKIDVGTRSKEETEALGVRMLQPIVLEKHYMTIQDRYVVTRALDNRIGVLIAIELLKHLVPEVERLGMKITFAWSVQEEIGLRGASLIANTIKPDYIVALDTASTTDAPDIGDAAFQPLMLGGGPVLRMVDSRAIASPFMRKIMQDVAERMGIPIQLAVAGGTTDGAALQMAGSLVMPVGIPVRYTHSPVEMADITDVEKGIDLLEGAVKEIASR